MGFPRNQQPTAISLFSGAGGMDLGFTRAGFHVLFSNEMDPDAAATYCSNAAYLDADAMHIGDIHDFLPAICKFSGTDLVFGGPPCQGFSVAGKMDPSDAKSELVFTFMNVVESLKPRVFVMENVRALAKLSKWQPVRERLFQQARELGYGCCLLLLNAADYGIPQARERMFFIGAAGLPSTMVEKLVEDKLSECRRVAPSAGEVLSSLPTYGSDGNPITCTAAIHLAKHPIIRRSPYAGSLLFNGRGRPINLNSVAKTLPAEMGGQSHSHRKSGAPRQSICRGLARLVSRGSLQWDHNSRDSSRTERFSKTYRPRSRRIADVPRWLPLLWKSREAVPPNWQRSPLPVSRACGRGGRISATSPNLQSAS